MNKKFGTFESKAQQYNQYRPRYSSKYQQYLKMNLHECSADVADIGAGTGIHAEILASIFKHVYAIEPVFEMLSVCEEALGHLKNIDFILASAETTSLPSSSIDYIIIGQAFHLLNQKLCIPEFKRILKKDGRVILVWIHKEPETPLFYSHEKILKSYCPCYQRDVHAQVFSRNTYKDLFLPESYQFTKLDFDSTEHLSMETFVNRTLSASYAIAECDCDYSSLVFDLESLFHKYARNNLLEVRQSTIIYQGILL